VAALHQGAPGQMTWLEDPPPWLKPCILLCFGNSEQKIKMLPYLTVLFYFDGEMALAARVFQLLLRNKVHSFK